jgi:hypothetical protein
MKFKAQEVKAGIKVMLYSEFIILYAQITLRIGYYSESAFELSYIAVLTI